MTLDGLEGPLSTLFQNTCVFRSHHKNFNEDSLILWRRRCSANDSNDYKVYAYIRGSYLEWQRQTTSQQWGN